MDHTDARTTLIEDQGDHPALERPPTPGDISNPTTTEHEWNGDLRHWESWPTGRPGPFVPRTALQLAINNFHFHDQRRTDLSRAEEKVFHLAEYSSSGRGEFDNYST